MRTNERLEELLDKKDEQIEELYNQVSELNNFKESLDFVHHRHFTIKNNGVREGLPYPRLEMILTFLGEDNRYGHKWVYGMVMKPYWFNWEKDELLLFIPFSETKSSGSHELIRNGKMERPFRDGLHIQADSFALSLPAFVICESLNHCEEINIEDCTESQLDIFKKMKTNNK